MEHNQLTINSTNFFLPKLKFIKFRNKRNVNFLLQKNPSFNKSNQNRNLSRNNSTRIKNDLNTATSLQLYSLKSIISKNENNNNKKLNNIINSYNYKKNDYIKKNINNNNPSIRKILFSNDKVNKLRFNILNKDNSKTKVNSAVDTKDLFLYKSKSKAKYRPLSNNKMYPNFISINDVNDFFISKRKKLKNNKFLKTKKQCITNRIKKDKYAFIYLSDNPESIKYSRRINYNPLDV